MVLYSCVCFLFVNFRELSSNQRIRISISEHYDGHGVVDFVIVLPKFNKTTKFFNDILLFHYRWYPEHRGLYENFAPRSYIFVKDYLQIFSRTISQYLLWMLTLYNDAYTDVTWHLYLLKLNYIRKKIKMVFFIVWILRQILLNIQIGHSFEHK